MHGLAFVDSLWSPTEPRLFPSSVSYEHVNGATDGSRYQIHSINLAGLQTLAADSVNLIVDGVNTVKFVPAGNFSDVGLLQHVRACLHPEIAVQWKLSGKRLRLQMSSKFNVQVFFNGPLGKKLGLVGHVITPTGDYAGFQVNIAAGTSFTAEFAVDVHANLHVLYLATRTEQQGNRENRWNVLTQFFPTTMISESRPNVLKRYTLVNQNYQRYNELRGNNTTFHLLDSEFQPLNSFHPITGRTQIVLDIQ